MGNGLPCRLLGRELPAGILSTKDALDNGNAYDSAKVANCRLTNTLVGAVSSSLGSSALRRHPYVVTAEASPRP
jgi:hypothetical protein